MKFKTIPLMAALLGPAFLSTGMAGAEPGREDLTKVYEAGRAAFNKGDFTNARTAFAKVLRAKPDFDLALIYMAQIRHVDAQWEARPRSQKIAEQARVAQVELKTVPLRDALEVVRRELERAGGGRKTGTIALLTDLPVEAMERPVSLSVVNLPLMQFIDCVAFAGEVRISWHPDGLSVTAAPAVARKMEPAWAAAVTAMREGAQTQVIPLIHFENASLGEAVHWLQGKSDPVRGPLIVRRGPEIPTKVNLTLRNSTVPDALRSLAILADLDVSWHPWGAGLSPKNGLTATTSVPLEP